MADRTCPTEPGSGKKARAQPEPEPHEEPSAFAAQLLLHPDHRVPANRRRAPSHRVCTGRSALGLKDRVQRAGLDEPLYVLPMVHHHRRDRVNCDLDYGPLAGWWRTADSRAAHAPIFATRVLVSSSTASFRTHAEPCNWMFTTVSWSRIAATTSPASPEDHTFDTGEDEVVDAEGDNEEADENDDGDDASLNFVVAMSRRHAMAHCWHTSAEPPCLFIAAATASTPPTRTTLSTFNGLL
eukprot:CAMPEP_0182542698 /NCGR_PEP_ID=MMETSP1323-20130603/30546_1 /TAXON_ID=236787 /ORGANISM="Florenciella parvula, Strain RCC1693" /LENGTH=239 /DNA_ID=CAMNT_0024753571 /DNA_START=220 /DNA_END=941 /DNA_ORIENTATION=-